MQPISPGYLTPMPERAGLDIPRFARTRRTSLEGTRIMGYVGDRR